MIITGIKLANPVNVAGRTEFYFKSEEYDISLSGDLITIKHKKKGDVVHTSIFNTIYFKTEPEIKETKQADGPKKRALSLSKRD